MNLKDVKKLESQARKRLTNPFAIAMAVARAVEEKDHGQQWHSRMGIEEVKRDIDPDEPTLLG